jgi:signal transduction histidine kinase
MYPHWTTQVMIPVLPLLALGSWLFGRKTALILAIPSLIYHYLISSVIYGDVCIYYEDRLSGTFIGVTLILLVGRLRDSSDRLKLTYARLDQRVAQRNAELDHLTMKLIRDVETIRIRHGQILHDGIGQHLTGIQLYCSSLEDQVKETIPPLASLVSSMRTKAEKAHRTIRKTARLLFPVRMNETGLLPAIKELASCLNEMERLSVDVTIQGDYGHTPDSLSLAVYRICHESAICAATGLEADVIRMTIDSQNAGYMVTVQHNGTPWSLLKNNMEQRLILYRLSSLGGSCSVRQSIDQAESITYRIPGTA